jgi:hypothetical protein
VSMTRRPRSRLAALAAPKQEGVPAGQVPAGRQRAAPPAAQQAGRAAQRAAAAGGGRLPGRGRLLLPGPVHVVGLC